MTEIVTRRAPVEGWVTDEDRSRMLDDVAAALDAVNWQRGTVLDERAAYDAIQRASRVLADQYARLNADLMARPGSLSLIPAPFPRIFTDNPGRDAACKTILHQLAAGDVVAERAGRWERLASAPPKPALRPRRWWRPAGEPVETWQSLEGGRRAKIMLAPEMTTGSVHTWRPDVIDSRGRPGPVPELGDRDPFSGETFPEPVTGVYGKPEFLAFNTTHQPVTPRFWHGNWAVPPGAYVELSAIEFDDLAARGLLDRGGLVVRRHATTCAAPQRPCDCAA
jgi:hypothetical protein